MDNDLKEREDAGAASAEQPDAAQAHYDNTFAQLTSAEHLAASGNPGDLSGGDASEGAASDATTASRPSAGEKTKSAITGKSAGDSKTTDPEQGGLFTGDDRRFSFGKFRISRKKGLTGGIIGLVMSAAAFFGIGAATGPFQFVHIAQLLTHAHFQHQNDAGDGRLSRMMRFLNTNGDIGETRLTYVESKFFKDPTIAKLKSMGFEINSESRLGTTKGVFVTSKEEGSPYHGKSNEEIKQILTEKYGKFGTVAQIADGKFYIKDTSLRGSLGTKIVDEAGYSKIGTALRSRILAKYTFATWHPLKLLDKKLNQKTLSIYDEWMKAREERLKTGVKGTTIDGTAAGETSEPDKNGNVTTAKEPGTVETPSSSQIKSILGEVAESKSFKVTGGLAAAAGLVCAAKAVDDKIGEIRYIQVVAPLIRMGMDAITVGNQLMWGHDVDMGELRELSTQFHSIATAVTKDGKTTTTPGTTWANSKSIKSNLGQSSGTDIPGSTKDMLQSGSPSWLDWTQTGPVGALCGTAGQVITGTVSVVVGILSGGIISTAAGALASGIGGPIAIDKLSSLLAGEAVNVAATGVEWGNDIDYGARLGANSAALGMGGKALTTKQVSVLDKQSLEDQVEEDSSKSFIARVFDPYDYRSLTSKVMDTTAQASPSSVASGFLGIGSSLSSMLANIFSPKASAATTTAYDYGFPEIGFSADELENKLYENPYENGELVAKMLDQNGQNGTPDYIQKAKDCFAVDITKGDQGWDVLPGDQSPGQTFNPYDGTYDTAGCASSDQNWTRIRFFILDTGVMEGMGCYYGDDRSCANDGMGSAAASTTTASSSSSVDQATMYQDSSQIACAAGTIDEGIQTGYYRLQPVPIRVCGIPGIPGSHSFTGKLALVNSRVSANFLALTQAAKSDGISLSADYSFRTMAQQEALCPCNGVDVARPGTSNHQMGLAIDFIGPSVKHGSCSSNRATDPSDPVWTWLNNNAAQFGIKQYGHESWHWDTLLDSTRCGGDGT